MKRIVTQVGPLATASTTDVAASQSVSGAAFVIINGARATAGLATLDTPRQISINSAGNDSGVTFTVLGTNWSGQPIGEAIIGANAGSAVSALDYATVSSVKTSGSTAAAVTVGTTAQAGGPWVMFDTFGTGLMTVQWVVNGTATASIQSTLDDPNALIAPTSPSAVNWIQHPDPAAQGFTSSGQANFNQHQVFVRTLLTAGTGYVTTTYLQGGSPGA